MNLLSREAAPVFNAVMGVLAAASAGFFVFAMPADLFASLVAATGIGSLVPAAQPPLGLTARMVAMALVAIAIFLLVWASLRRIDALGDERPEAEDEAARVLPRLRRADAHPDAPVRRPLLAGAELGEPAEAALPAEAVDGAVSSPEDLAAENIALPLPEEAALVAEGAPPPQATDAPDGHVAEEAIEEVAAPAEPLPLETETADVTGDADASLSTEDLMARLPLPEDRGESISVLFRRLDAGLASFEWPLRPSDQEDAAQAEPRDPVDDQLRNALDDLRKMAGGSP